MALPWLKLFKQIVHNVLYFSEPFDKTHAWIDLLLLAKDEDQDMMVGLKKVSVPRGDVTESYEELATRWKWSKTKVARFIDFLEEEGMIEKKRNGRDGSLTVVKYEFFQGKVSKSGTIAEQSRNNDGTIAEQSIKDISNNINNIYKRDVKDKREEGEDNTPITLKSNTPTWGAKKQFVPPTLEELEDFCYENNLSIDPATFIDYYTANGWMAGKNHMKDWKATARNWDRRRKNEQRQGYIGGGKNAKAAQDMHNGFDMIDSLVARMEGDNDIS